MLRKFKEPRIDKLQEVLSESNFAFLVDFSGTTIGAVEEFKSSVRENNGDYLVAKNTLAKVALNRLDNEDWCEEIAAYFSKSTALVFGSEDIGACAKAIKKFHKANKDKFKIKAILFDRKVYGPEEFESFTNLLTMDELKSKLLGLLMAPQSSLARVLKARQRDFAAVLKAYAEKS